MGRVRTAAAKKYIEEEQCGSSNDENVAVSKRSARSKRGGSTANNNHSTARPSTGRTSRSTRQSTPVEKEKEKENGKNGIMNINVSDDSISEDEVVVNRKRKSSVENVIAKKQKASTSASSSAPALKTVGRPKKEKSSKKKKDKEDEEERYEVEAILDHKFEDNSKYFLIRWKGYDSSVDSWEKSYNISCPGLLAQYYELHPEASVGAKTATNKRKKKNFVPKPRQLKIDEQFDYESEWDENEDYEVGRIIDVRYHRNNKRDFLIRWKGYSSKSDSWEPEENLDCKDLIDTFMEKFDRIKNVTQKDLRPVRSQTQRFTLMTQGSARRLSKRNQNQQRAVYYDCEE